MLQPLDVNGVLGLWIPTRILTISSWPSQLPPSTTTPTRNKGLYGLIKEQAGG